MISQYLQWFKTSLKDHMNISLFNSSILQPFKKPLSLDSHFLFWHHSGTF